jgi:hypothetical protein
MSTSQKVEAKKMERGNENYALDVDQNAGENKSTTDESMSSILAEAAVSCANIACVTANAHGCSDEGWLCIVCNLFRKKRTLFNCKSNTQNETVHRW